MVEINDIMTSLAIDMDAIIERHKNSIKNKNFQKKVRNVREIFLTKNYY